MTETEAKIRYLGERTITLTRLLSMAPGRLESKREAERETGLALLLAAAAEAETIHDELRQLMEALAK